MGIPDGWRASERRSRQAARNRKHGLPDFWTGQAAEPLPAMTGYLEAPTEDKIGICCSGGGIRSASYSLGGLQVLQEEGKLNSADYLSAVSGGSYIAAGFVLAGHTRGCEGSNEDGLKRVKPFSARSPEEQFLRNRTTYLAPHGQARAFFVLRFLLGPLFNLGLLALAVAIPALGLGLLLGWTHFDGENLNTPAWSVIAVAALAACAALLAAHYVLSEISDSGRRLWIQTWVVRLLVLSATMAALFLLIPWLADRILDLDGQVKDPTDERGMASVLAPLSALAGIAGGIAAALSGPAKLLKGDAKRTKKLITAARVALVSFVGAVLFPALVLGWAIAVVTWVIDRDGVVAPIGALAVTVAWFALLMSRADVVSWSLHPFYRSRLCSVFALRREKPDANVPGDPGLATPRDPYKIPRFDELGEQRKPRLLVCAAANVSDAGATPHGRRVTSFTFEPGRIGGPLVGYEDIRRYHTDFDRPRDDVMHAVATSGAAISPSMGKLTIAPARALLALANVRLGVWMPNPRKIETASKVASRPRPHHLLFEIFGMNSLDRDYVYVTDGGHYENLGLVELLRRGCTEIYCFDASGGPTLDALGDAMAIARAELGVEIPIDTKCLAKNIETGFSEADVAAVGFEYPDRTKGCLLYARQTLTAELAYDVLAHAGRDTGFPHDSTGDQFFTDQALEAYRELGRCAARHALTGLASWRSNPESNGQIHSSQMGDSSPTSAAPSASQSSPPPE